MMSSVHGQCYRESNRKGEMPLVRPVSKLEGQATAPTVPKPSQEDPIRSSSELHLPVAVAAADDPHSPCSALSLPLLPPTTQLFEISPPATADDYLSRKERLLSPAAASLLTVAFETEHSTNHSRLSSVPAVVTPPSSSAAKSTMFEGNTVSVNLFPESDLSEDGGALNEATDITNSNLQLSSPTPVNKPAVVSPPRSKDVMWLLSAMRPGVAHDVRLEAAGELRVLAKTADDAYWLKNCAQVELLAVILTPGTYMIVPTDCQRAAGVILGRGRFSAPLHQ